MPLSFLPPDLPVATLAPGAVLVEQGTASGRLYVLLSGSLEVLREGVAVTAVTAPGAIVGEISLLLGIRHSATVRALIESRVAVIEEGLAFLGDNPALALHIATTASQRLNDTTALLVQLLRDSGPGRNERGALERLFTALSGAGRIRPHHE